MARTLTLTSDWLYRDPIDLDDIERGQFTQDDNGTYHLSAQTLDGTYWAPRTILPQHTDTKPAAIEYWPPHSHYPTSNGTSASEDFVDTSTRVIIRTINADTALDPYDNKVTGAIGDIVVNLDATLTAANHKSMKAILLPNPETTINEQGPAGSQKTGKTFRVQLAADPDGEQHGMSLLKDGQYYHIAISNYLT